MKTRVVLALGAVIAAVAGCLLYLHTNRAPDLRFNVNDPMAPFQGGSEALDYVLAHADTMPSIQLFVGASTAYHLERWQDAAFLFYAARVRARYELKKYKPTDDGGNSPAILPTFLIANSEERIVGEINKRPEDRAEVMRRLDEWTIREPWGFDPGWKYTLQDLPADAAAREVAAVHKYRPGSRVYYASNFFADEKVAELAEAAKYGDVERIDAIVAEGVDVNTKGNEGMPLLFYAISGDSLDGFRRLLERGANPNQQADNGDSVVSRAAARQESEALKLAILHGGNPNLRAGIPPSTPNVTYIDSTPTPIFNAIRSRNPDNARILIKAGADLSVRDSFGNTPLMEAASSGSFEVMYALLEAGADYRAKNEWGYTVTRDLLQERAGTPPQSQAFKARQKCIEFLRNKGIDFEKEKLRNAEIERKNQERRKKAGEEGGKVRNGFPMDK
jgi:ankyrin repeat protein